MKSCSQVLLFSVKAVASKTKPSQIWQAWCVNYGADKQRYLLCFASIRDELSRDGGCVYIHCKSGKGRSAFTVYSLLRLEYSFSDEAARAALATRLGTHGQRIANVDVRQECNQTWLEKTFRNK